MITLVRTYSEPRAARVSAHELRDAGVPEGDIQIIAGSRLHDRRREPSGHFAGTAPPDARVGTFGNTRRLRRQGSGAFAGDADRRRRGSFADSERAVVVTHDAAGDHAHVAGHHAVDRLLEQLALDDEARGRIAGDLDRGRATLVVELAEIAPSDVESRLDAPRVA